MTIGLLARLLRLLSRVACLIVIASFALFAIHQTSHASTHQVDELTGTTQATNTESLSSEGSVRRTIDEAANTITKPFAGLTSGSKNKWVVHGGNTLLAVLIYGLGVGFVARVLTVRV